MDGDWDGHHMCQRSDSNSDFELYPDGASNVDVDVEGAVLARSARGDGGGSVGFGGGGSMERYASVQHELRGISLSLLASAVQLRQPWHGYTSHWRLHTRPGWSVIVDLVDLRAVMTQFCKVRRVQNDFLGDTT